MYYTCAYGECSTGWLHWGRWLLLGILVAIFIAAILLTQTWSRRRVQRGETPVYGTGWMLPSYNQSQQQSGNPSAPPYGYPTQGGYYDHNGNYVQYDASYVPPTTPGHSQTNHHPPQQNYEMQNTQQNNGKVSAMAPPPAYGG